MQELAPHQQRVVAEKQELDARLGALTKFFGTPTFNGLDSSEVIRLRRQHHFMTGYLEVLGDRIAAFS
jgi:hypothetical protein